MLYTLFLLAVFRLGAHIPVPGINTGALRAYAATQGAGTIFSLIDMFSGGAFRSLTIFALGIMPYISASIILQLLTVVVPYLERLAKEGEAGRRKLVQYTRYATVGLTAFQAYGLSRWVSTWKEVVYNPGIGFQLLMIITLCSGTAFLMWIGEQITEKGLGNGISLIIFAGIVARLPDAVRTTIRDIKLGQMSIFSAIVLLVILGFVVAMIVLLTQAQRKLPIQHAQRIVGRKVYSGSSTYLPLRVNHAGVIPIIFASAVLSFPATIAQFFGGEKVTGLIRPFIELFNPYSDMYSLHALVPEKFSTIPLFYPLKAINVYSILYVLLIVFFTYFYTAVTFNPTDIADNLKKYGAYIPGVRPGKFTSDLIDRILTRITLPGAIAIAFIAILPEAVTLIMGIPPVVSGFLGGTGLIILVGVALDTVRQIESHLIMRHYEGFLKKGRIKGRGF